MHDLTRPQAASNDRLLKLLTANKGRGYHDVRNAGRTAHVYLFDEIGFWGTTAQDFARQVAPLDVEEIVLHLNSPGGEAWDGQAIYHTLRNHKASVEIRVEGIAASAASTIAMAASPGRLIMAPHSQMMVHEAMVMAAGNKRELQQAIGWLSELDNSIAGFYRDRAGGDIATWLEVMAATTWYTDRGAVDAGLADKVDGDADAAPENIFDLSAFANTPTHLLLTGARDADRKLSKREAEQALRDAGLPAAAAKAVLASGWSGIDVDPRDEDASRLLAVLQQLNKGEAA